MAAESVWARRAFAAWLLTSSGGCRIEHEYRLAAEYSVAPEEARAVRLGAPAVQVAVGSLHACAMLVGGEIRCWGDVYRDPDVPEGNRFIGDDEHPFRAKVMRLGRTARSIAAGGLNSCALLEDNSVACWGHTFGEVPQQILSPGSAVALSMGAHYVCALLPDAGGADCRRILGKQVRREGISFEETIGQIGAGDHAACALTLRGDKVVCWLWSAWQEKLHRSSVTLEVPAQELTMGSEHVCVRSDGHAHCWMVGEDPPRAPTNGLLGGELITAVRAGGQKTCVMLGGGGARCVSAPQERALESRDESVGVRQIRFDRPIFTIASSDDIACAVLEGGSVRCWGRVMPALGDPFRFQRTLRQLRRDLRGKR